MRGGERWEIERRPKTERLLGYCEEAFQILSENAKGLGLRSLLSSNFVPAT